jgi:hypothetical protein
MNADNDYRKEHTMTNTSHNEPNQPPMTHSSKRFHIRSHSSHKNPHKRLHFSDSKSKTTMSPASNSLAYSQTDEALPSAVGSASSASGNEINNLLLRTLTEILTNQLMLTRKVDSIKTNIDLINQRLSGIFVLFKLLLRERAVHEDNYQL